MKIVIIDTTIQSSLIGGAQTFLPLLMKGLKERGHEVHLVTKGPPHRKIEKQIQESGAIVHTSLWKKKYLAEEAAPVFARWVNAMVPDIYLISVSPDVGWVVLPYLNPAIATFTIGHTDDETFYLPARHYQPFITKAIGVSDEVCRQYISRCNFAEQDVSWIPYGVMAKPSAPDEHNNKTIHLIYVGRIVEEQKRISDLIKIVQQLAARHIPFHIKIIGDGTEMPLLKEKLQKEIKENKVQLLGWLKMENIIDHLRHTDLFILTSSYEGFCIALVEAMANGCCPLVTDIKSGNKQLITHGQNGFIFPVGDINAFVQKIAALAAEPEKIFSLRKSAWETGKNYSVERMTLAYEEHFITAAAAVKKHFRNIDEDFPLMETCRSSWPLWIRRIKAAIK